MVEVTILHDTVVLHRLPDGELERLHPFDCLLMTQEGGTDCQPGLLLALFLFILPEADTKASSIHPVAVLVEGRERIGDAKANVPCMVELVVHRPRYRTRQSVPGEEGDSREVIGLRQLHLVAGQERLLAGEKHGGVVLVGFRDVLGVAPGWSQLTKERGIGDDVKMFVQTQ